MKRAFPCLYLVLAAFLQVCTLSAQDMTGEPPGRSDEMLLSDAVGFLGITVGMSREQVLQVAESGELISVKPEVPFIYLQFFNDLLYAITVIFDERYMDFYTLSDSLERKYGEYTNLTPQWRQWQLDRVTIKVEKPAVVKYIALKDFLEAASFDGSPEYPDMEKRNRLLEGL
jgi:hypothetical protein